MGILSVFKRRISDATNQDTQSSPLDPRAGGFFWLPMPWIPDGLALNPHQAFEVAAVWGCVSIIASSIAQSPWNILQVEQDGRRTLLPHDPLAYLLNVTPNGGETMAIGFREGLICQALIHGAGYAEIQRNKGAKPIGLQPLLSERMQLPTRDEYDRKIYYYTDPKRGQIRYFEDDLFILPGLSLDGVTGAATVQAALKLISTAAAQDRFTTAYFGNAATPSGILKVQSTLNPKQKKELKQEFAEKQNAARNNGKPLVLDESMDWKQMGSNPQESQLVEGKQSTLEAIAAYFRVPVHLLASAKGSQGYGKNLAELGHALINYGLRPWVTRLEQQARIKLTGPNDRRVTLIDLSALSRGDPKEDAETDKILVEAGIFTRNEIRVQHGANSGPAELDRFFVTNTQIPIEVAIETPRVVPSPAPQPAPAKTEPDEPGDPDPEPQIGEPDPTARPILATALARALRDHDRRWKARSRDLKQNVEPAKLEAQLAAARDQLRVKLAEDIADLLPVADKLGCPVETNKLAEAVEAGADPKAVASHHVGVES